MIIEQFNDEALAHYSYAIVSEGQMAIVDPSRNPMPYYVFAEAHNAKIVAVFETHPHADFISSHLQIHEETTATIFVSKLVGADYDHKSFDEGDSFQLGKVNFSALNTPGHSPDSITVVAKEGEETALFTGDTLFIGNVGRPDLRENAGNMKAKRIELAKDMYNTMQTKFNDLPDDALVYPAHGAGSLCGKNMSSDSSSTLGNERMGNWAFKEQSEEEFVEEILKDQPFIPSYFGFDVDVNKTGALNVQKAKYNVPIFLNVDEVEEGLMIVDTRGGDDFKKSHLPGSINIMATSPKQKFETWLGAIIQPEEYYYLVVPSVENIDALLERVAKIGYEKQLKAVITVAENLKGSMEFLEVEDFKEHPSEYTIVDIRNASEVAEGKFFERAIPIPLNELRNRTDEIPTDKPIVVHCAGGYRSAAGSSIIDKQLSLATVFDLSDAVKDFK
ncbi:MBL fold metallo-hydrolase [Zunongwangia profunda]|mgnify:FL=1|jgi:glyoxylase-like metal-dependent hydrolase (beta-lactamase superfamily II)/rhodanese-related sulfurtransferase|uniref:MBL fold metallo-hydrolase n=1 Tax=Zunongwangia profunda TaxID=398743 RepID=UPI001D18609F|nr:rhodanese-like domain-containing protein [Zunongwangia profunda]MCC4229296.1 MBL fold metallo-hydrolase [Zunongwangia profunda]